MKIKAEIVNKKGGFFVVLDEKGGKYYFVPGKNIKNGKVGQKGTVEYVEKHEHWVFVAE